MIVADTNVLSEPLRIAPDPGVLGWLAANRHELALTSISVAELRFGALRLPAGRRRELLNAAIDELVDSAGERVLHFDRSAAEEYARLRAAREAAGRQVSVEDTMIAAICISTGSALATRNVADFLHTGLVVHNPWATSPPPAHPRAAVRRRDAPKGRADRRR